MTVNQENVEFLIEKHLNDYKPSQMPDTVKQDIIKLMKAEALRHGQDKLPEFKDHIF